MKRSRLTKRILTAMSEAVSAMEAGQEGEGDWPPELPRRDLEDADRWVSEQLAKRVKPTQEGI